jgi:hypothetical protein
MRLLAEIVVISALIYFGWNTPFKQWSNRVTAEIQTLLQSKRQTSPAGIMIIAPIIPGTEEMSAAR